MSHMASSQFSPRDGAAPGPLGVVGKYLTILAQLALILLVVHLFQIENRRYFHWLLMIAAGGFAVHAWAPMGARRLLFVLLTWFAMCVLIGPLGGITVIAVVTALLAISYLPVAFAMRALMMGGGVLWLAIYRNEMGEVLKTAFRGSLAKMTFLPSNIWSTLDEAGMFGFAHVSVFLGSILMFRTIVYLYDLRREGERPPFVESLCYFFMLPNPVFHFFPIVDFKTQRQTYYDTEAYKIYQTGVSWIVQGLIHLLLYRMINYYLLPDMGELNGVWMVFVFLVTNLALYLVVSGHFHVIIGVMQLFGFHLPRTHDNYFLASSFTDIWRRINIYWKAFMSKVFFMPAFFAMRRLGTRTAIVLAIGWSFLWTWLLHAWQAYWLMGTGQLQIRTAALWMFAASLVAVNAMLDYRRAAQRRPISAETTPAKAVVRAFQTVAIFMLVSLFWALWPGRGFIGLFAMAAFEQPSALRETFWVVGALLSAVAVLATGFLVHATLTRRGWAGRPLNFSQSALANVAILLVGAAIGTPAIMAMFGDTAAKGVAYFQEERHTAAQAQQIVANYYEELVQVDTTAFVYYNPGLQGLLPPTKQFWHMSRMRDDILQVELIPNWQDKIYNDFLSVNSFGMRNRETTKDKPPETCRIAFVGGSNVMGFGVADDETFPHLIEEKLNADRAQGDYNYESLNFGVGRFYPLQRTVLLERKIVDFKPDAVFYFSDQSELPGLVQHMSTCIEENRRGYEMPYPCLDELIKKAGVRPGSKDAVGQKDLRPVAFASLQCVYDNFARICKENGAVPVWIALPIPAFPQFPDFTPRLSVMAEKAGFVVVNASGWHAGHDPMSVRFSIDDAHPTVLGHQLIAKKIFEELQKNPKALPDCGPETDAP